MTETKLDRNLGSLALLAEPARRALYEYVAGRHEAVGRDEAARATGLSRKLAAFHLDRLADAGMLEVSYARLSGRTGPGAGRPAKLYRRSARTFEVSVPARDYELPARLLARGAASNDAWRTEARAAAREAGLAVGREAATRAGRRPSRARAVEALTDVLTDRGFEPTAEGRRCLRLGNCPFDALAREQTDVMCGMNHAMLDGMVDGLGVDGVRAVLEPEPGWCCVRVRW